MFENFRPKLFKRKFLTLKQGTVHVDKIAQNKYELHTKWRDILNYIFKTARYFSGKVMALRSKGSHCTFILFTTQLQTLNVNVRR